MELKLTKSEEELLKKTNGEQFVDDLKRAVSVKISLDCYRISPELRKEQVVRMAKLDKLVYYMDMHDCSNQRYGDMIIRRNLEF